MNIKTHLIRHFLLRMENTQVDINNDKQWEKAFFLTLKPSYKLQ